MFIAYLAQLYSPIRALGLANSIFAAAAGAERVLELLDEAPTVTERPTPAALARARGQVELRGVAYAHPGAGDALAGVDLCVRPGEIVALAGPAAPASRRSRGCWCASPTRGRARSCSTATTCAT